MMSTNLFLGVFVPLNIASLFDLSVCLSFTASAHCLLPPPPSHAFSPFPLSGVVWAGEGTVNGQRVGGERGEEVGEVGEGGGGAPREFLCAPNVEDTVLEAAAGGDGLLVYLMYPIEEWE